MTGSDWTALAVGSYGSVVATVALVWNILGARRNVTVRVRYARGFGFLSGSEAAAIEVINKGHRPIHIEEVGFFLSNGLKLIPHNLQNDLGWLKDGDGKSYYVPRQELDEMRQQAQKKGVTIVAAYVRDSTSTYYKGKIRKGAEWFDE
ncbi:MAG: hypothetical protein V1691_03590 [Chloroflexota bacterium]